MTTTAQEAPTPETPDRPEEVTGRRDQLRRWYGDHRDTLRMGLGLTALFTVVSVVMAFPDPHLWRTHTPGDYGDSFLLQWLLRWDFHALVTRGSPVFDPNIYWPHENTLVYTDTQLAIAPVAGILAKLTDWTVAYNLVYLSGWVISAAAAYLLARWIGATRPASVLCALVFTFAAVRLGHYGHFQLQFAYFVPLALWFLLRFLDERKAWQAIGVGLCSAATFLNAGYIALVLGPTLVIVALGWVVATRFRPGPRFVRGMAAIAVVALIPTLSVIAAYGTWSEHLQRDYYHEAAVTPRHFLGPVEGTLLYGWLRDRINAPFENQLFPGFAAIALGAVGTAGLALDARRRRAAARAEAADADATDADAAGPPASAPAPDDERARIRRRGLILVCLASLVPLILAFGEYQTVRGRRIPLPYELVSEWPGFQSIRAFGRFVVVPLLAGALLVAVGFDRLVRHRHRWTRVGAAVAIGAFMLLEYKGKIVMAPRIDRNPELTAVNHALAKLPHAAVLELPMGDSWGPAWAYVEAPRMVLSSIDWRPRVNGYSGYEPPAYHYTIETLNTLDDGGPATADALGRLEHLRVGYIVIRMAPPDQDWSALGVSFLDEEGAQRVVDALPPEWIVDVTREGAATLVQLRPPPPGRPSTP
ncbi:MAG: hypothetical protein ACLGI2_08370 [Acidimicrobiia bacterium]